MTRASRMLSGLFGLILVLSGCASGDGDNDRSSEAASEATPSALPSPRSVEITSSPADRSFCDAGPGRTVQELPDVGIPSLQVPEVLDPESGEVVVPEAVLPEQTVAAGCIVRFDAPGGCLGAVAISPVTVPGLEIPGFEVDGKQVKGVSLPPETREAVSSPQVCRVTRNEQQEGVTRAGVVREGFSRPGAARQGYGDIEAVRIEPVDVPDVDVEPQRLQSVRLAGSNGVRQLRGGNVTSFVAPAKVLFDTDSAELRAAAVPSLRVIARRIGQQPATRRVLVEGHTDDRGSASHGLTLSRQRADAVARWLERSGGIDQDRVQTRGLGERAPVVPNDTAAHRQLNRRVVISLIG